MIPCYQAPASLSLRATRAAPPRRRRRVVLRASSARLPPEPDAGGPVDGKEGGGQVLSLPPSLPWSSCGGFRRRRGGAGGRSCRRRCGRIHLPTAGSASPSGAGDLRRPVGDWLQKVRCRPPPLSIRRLGAGSGGLLAGSGGSLPDPAGSPCVHGGGSSLGAGNGAGGWGCRRLVLGAPIAASCVFLARCQ